MVAIYIHYAKNAANQMVIACYHEKVQCLANAIILARKLEIPHAALQKLEILIPEPYTTDDVKIKFLELLQIIKTDSSPISQVHFTSDLNLCCYEKKELAPFLFDNTIHHFFQDAKYIHLTLESMDHEYVLNAIALADSRDSADLVIKTKSGVQENRIYKSYPSSAEKSQPSFFKNAKGGENRSSDEADSYCLLG